MVDAPHVGCNGIIGNGVLKVMKDCRNGCPRLRSMDEARSMNDELDKCFLYRRNSIIKSNDIC